ncbi:hypothetical protein ACFE04_007161 [Oxalis oulophora]
MLDEEQEDDQQVPVWQKNIIMGGKCELPDFSGVIIYDSEGQPCEVGQAYFPFEELEPNAGVLTNFEVLDFLRERGAAKDPTRIISRVAPSEYKVYDYLVASPAGSQTIEEIKKFEEESKRFKLAKAEVLNIINNRPSLLVDVEPVNLSEFHAHLAVLLNGQPSYA